MKTARLTARSEGVSRSPRPVRHRRCRHRHRDRWPGSRHDGERGVVALARSAAGAVLPGKARALLAAACPARRAFRSIFCATSRKRYRPTSPGVGPRPRLRDTASSRPTDLPRLEGSLASLICTKRDVYEGGDHWLVTLEVRQLHRGVEPLRPLLFFRGNYRRVDARMGTSAPDLVNTADEPVQMYYHEP